MRCENAMKINFQTSSISSHLLSYAVLPCDGRSGEGFRGSHPGEEPLPPIISSLTRQNRSGVLAVCATHVRPEDLRSLEMALRAGGGGEVEDGGRGDHHREAMGHESVLRVIAVGTVGFDHATDWVGHAVAQVHTRVAEADAGEAAG